MQLRNSLGCDRACQAADRTGRSQPSSIFPFGTATGRNAHARSLYNFPRRDALADASSPTARSASTSTGKRKRSVLLLLGPETCYYRKPTKATSITRWLELANRTHDPDPLHWKKD